MQTTTGPTASLYPLSGNTRYHVKAQTCDVKRECSDYTALQDFTTDFGM